jgi:ribonuclease HI
LILIAIDGSARRPTKPDCLSAGVVFAKQDEHFHWYGVNERNSTSQRGEISAINKVIDNRSLYDASEDVYVITDSEYVFNTISKDWLGNWNNKGWISSAGTPVKNQDLWKPIYAKLLQYEQDGLTIVPFCVKGHLFSIGKTMVKEIMKTDPTGEFLYRTAHNTVVDAWDSKPVEIDAALLQFKNVNGYLPPVESFITMIVANTVADSLAGYYIDQIDAEWIR